MPPVTADSNIYISALQFGGVPLQFLERARAGDFQLAISPAILMEVRRVLQEKFAWPSHDITEALSDLEMCTTCVYPTQTIAVITADPDDDRILECAVAAGSD